MAATVLGQEIHPEQDRYLCLPRVDILAEETEDKMKKSVKRLRTTVLVEILQGIQVGRDKGPAVSSGTFQCQGPGMRPVTRKGNRGGVAGVILWCSAVHKYRGVGLGRKP